MKSLPNILIVDDNPDHLTYLEIVLKPHKIRLIKAGSGLEALKKIANTDLALAIIDVRMPGMNGYELAMKMNEEKSGEKVPIIFITANFVDEMQLFKGYGSGAVDFIFKPINNDILYYKVQVFLDLFNQKQTIVREAELLKKYAQRLAGLNVSLRTSREYLDKIINSVASPIFVKDDRYRFCLVNDALCKLLAVPAEDLLGETGFEHFPDDQNDVFLAKDREVFNTGRENINEEFLTDGAGKIRTIITSKTLYTDPSGNKFLVGIINDITERKEMEEKFLASEKLAVMGRLVADVAHEINNPLAIIMGRTQLMLRRIDNKPTLFKAQLTTILDSARRCKVILSGLLSYSRTIGKDEDVVNLHDMILEAVDNVNYQYEMNAIEIVLRCNVPDNIEIKGNKVALLSVFVNLIRNARQAMGENGNLSIFVDRDNRNQVKIEIRDTGIGISAEEMEKLFKPFISGWKEGEGTGLGLATSRGIIETHGGTMTAESEGEGKGAKFIIHLPYKLKKKESTQLARKMED